MRKTFISQRPVKNTYGSSRPARSRFAILRTTTAPRFTISEFTSKMSILIYFMCLVHWRRSKIIRRQVPPIYEYAVMCTSRFSANKKGIKRFPCTQYHIIVRHKLFVYVCVSALASVCNALKFVYRTVDGVGFCFSPSVLLLIRLYCICYYYFYWS